jgi:hypothetical protein
MIIKKREMSHRELQKTLGKLCGFNGPLFLPDPRCTFLCSGNTPVYENEF